MTLTIQCHENAEYRSTLLGLGQGKARRGAVAAEFPLCPNHSILYEQIDAELVQEAWAPAHTGAPVSLL